MLHFVKMTVECMNGKLALFVIVVVDVGIGQMALFLKPVETVVEFFINNKSIYDKSLNR